VGSPYWVGGHECLKPCGQISSRAKVPVLQAGRPAPTTGYELERWSTRREKARADPVAGFRSAHACYQLGTRFRTWVQDLGSGLGLKVYDRVDDTEQDAKSHLKAGAGVGWVGRLAAVAAEQRANIIPARTELLLRRLRDAEINLVAGMHLHRILGA